MKNKPRGKTSAGSGKEHLVTIFTRHPVKEKHPFEEMPSKIELSGLPSPYVSDLDLDPTVMLPLACKENSFRGTQNPVYLIEAFLLAHESGYYPPMWVLSRIAEVFREYHASNGDKDIEKLFGFKSGVGRTSAFQTLIEEERDELLTVDVFKLNVLFKISIEDASYMVASRLAESPDWNKTSVDIKEISAETIKDKYLRKWKKIWDNEYLRRKIKVMPREAKIAFLKAFPMHSIPPKFRDFLD